ncbi:MAG: DnaA/Hda family protein [Parasphingorhabdus sp.]|uniref:DnaA ATPase domain-containing protein n=1 Tax=Parasphingorhabdus sp. TaxID=2709688 RepID=UPI003299A60D
MSQFALPLDIESTAQAGGYLVTACNAEVHAKLEDWRHWPNHSAILIGGAGSGKHTMAEAFAKHSGGQFVRNADNVPADELFHLWNQAQAEAFPLLFLSSRNVSDWDISLPDLKSRVAASLLIEIGEPDEAMIAGLFQKYFALRGISISEDALTYLSKRIERSYQNVQLLAQKMNILAIEKKKPVTRAIAMEILAQHQSDTSSDVLAPNATPNGEEK